MSFLCVSDRVRVKFGADRGHYGTVKSVNGDTGDYFGVKLDCHHAEIGYSGYELEFIDRGKRPLWTFDAQSMVFVLSVGANSPRGASTMTRRQAGPLPVESNWIA
jgi:hypothetical protein